MRLAAAKAGQGQSLVNRAAQIQVAVAAADIGVTHKVVTAVLELL
jgi:hypothetical protein